jgi:hypothetical protein
MKDEGERKKENRKLKRRLHYDFVILPSLAFRAGHVKTQGTCRREKGEGEKGKSKRRLRYDFVIL